jgi:hypothetical protein
MSTGPVVSAHSTESPSRNDDEISCGREEYNGRHHGDFARLYVFYPSRSPQLLSNWP